MYGNSPLHTVEENNTGGMFTVAVLEVLGTDNGSTELHELTNKMNITLHYASNQKQIVFRHGSTRMDKLILVSDNQQKTADIDLKSNEMDQVYEIDEIEEQRAAVLKEAWNDHINGTNNRLWKDSIVPYTIDASVGTQLKKHITAAIKDFSDMTPVQWIPYHKDKKHDSYCIFVQDDSVGFLSGSIGRNIATKANEYEHPLEWNQLVGVNKEKISWQKIFAPDPNASKYKTGKYKNNWWWKISVMHEMMHALGFCHEFCRSDWTMHCKTNKQAMFSTDCIKFGQYDYKSIMQYENNVAYAANNDEYARQADWSPTFSQGDLACLRRIYGQNNKGQSIVVGKQHFGHWHKQCSSKCTSVLPGGVKCGYIGTNGHWTCCMNENKDSICNSTHTGYWHGPCYCKSWQSNHKQKVCYCGSCGGGCTYDGYKPHWSCCTQENYGSICKFDIYKSVKQVKIKTTIILTAQKRKKQRTDISNTKDEKKEEKIQNNKNNNISMIDLNFEDKFKYRKRYLNELMGIIFNAQIYWTRDKKNSRLRKHSKAWYINNNPNVCIYDVPIAKSTVIVSHPKQSLLDIFQYFIENKYAINSFYKWKKCPELLHSFNKHERIMHAVNESSAAPRDWLVYETGVLLDGSTNMILPKDKYIRNNNKLYTLNDDQFKKPLDFKVLYLFRSLLKNDAFYTKQRSDYARGTFYRAGFCIEKVRINSSELKVTTVFEFDIGGHWLAKTFADKKVVAIAETLTVGEIVKRFLERAPQSRSHTQKQKRSYKLNQYKLKIPLEKTSGYALFSRFIKEKKQTDPKLYHNLNNWQDMTLRQWNQLKEWLRTKDYYFFGYKGYDNETDLPKQYGGGFFESKEEQMKVATKTWAGWYCSRNINVARDCDKEKRAPGGGLGTVFIHKNGINNICNLHNCQPTYDLADPRAIPLMNYVKGPNVDRYKGIPNGFFGLLGFIGGIEGLIHKDGGPNEEVVFIGENIRKYIAIIPVNNKLNYQPQYPNNVLPNVTMMDDTKIRTWYPRRLDTQEKTSQIKNIANSESTKRNESNKGNIQQALISMGFQPNYIRRAFKVYEKYYGKSYDIQVITGIIVGLQSEDSKFNKYKSSVSSDNKEFKDKKEKKDITFMDSFFEHIKNNGAFDEEMHKKLFRFVTKQQYDSDALIRDIYRDATQSNIINHVNNNNNNMNPDMAITLQNILRIVKISPGRHINVTPGFDAEQMKYLIANGIAYVISAASIQSAKCAESIANDVRDLKTDYETGIASLVTMYNKTASQLVYDGKHDDSGYMFENCYPQVIQAGGNGCFLHAHGGPFIGSIGYIKYKIQYYDQHENAFKDSGQYVKWGWDTPYMGDNSILNNEIEGKGVVAQDTYQTTATCGQTTSPMYDFTLTETHHDAIKNNIQNDINIASITPGIDVGSAINQGVDYAISQAEKQSGGENAATIVGYVQDMKFDYGYGVSSLVVMYNTSISRLIYDSRHDESGHIGEWPYPPLIEAGGNGCFLHVHASSTMCGSIGSVTYKIQYYDINDGFVDSGQYVKWGWHTPYSGKNSVSDTQINGPTVAKNYGTYATTAAKVAQNASPLYQFTITETKKEEEKNKEFKDETENKMDEKVFTLYDNWKYSVFQSIVNEHSKKNNSVISNELYCKLMDNICGLFDLLKTETQQSAANSKGFKQQLSDTDLCFKLVTKDKNRNNEIASIAALYHDSWTNIERIKQNASYKKQYEESKFEGISKSINEKVDLNFNFKANLLNYYTAVDCNAKQSTGHETVNENETLFDNDQIKDWLWNVGLTYVNTILWRKVDYRKPTKDKYETDNVFILPPQLDDNLRIGLIGDWGSGTQVARNLLQTLLTKHKPNIIIHLGDVYYSGSQTEFADNYCDILNNYRKRYGKCVVFSIPGNHDWYGGGDPFYNAVNSLNKSAECIPDWFKSQQQTKSFFVIKNKYWQLQGMDTGRDDMNPASVKTGYYPQLQKEEAEYHNYHINKVKDEKRNIILFSHHPLFSAFERVGKTGWFGDDIFYNKKLSKQFENQLQYVTAWYWGHEHHFAIYDKNSNKNKNEQILAKGRLLGHSAVPLQHKDKTKNYIVPVKKVKDAYPLVKTKDNIPVCIKPSNDRQVFNHGYAILELKKDTAITTYWEIEGGGHTSNEYQTYQEDLLQ